VFITLQLKALRLQQVHEQTHPTGDGPKQTEDEPKDSTDS